MDVAQILRWYTAVTDPADDPELCAQWPGCSSAASAQEVQIVVFVDSAAADEMAGRVDPKIDQYARMHWLLIDFSRSGDPNMPTFYRGVLADLFQAPQPSN